MDARAAKVVATPEFDTVRRTEVLLFTKVPEFRKLPDRYVEPISHGLPRVDTEGWINMNLPWKPCTTGEYVAFKRNGITLRIEVRNMPDFRGGASWSWVIRGWQCTIASGFYLPTMTVAKHEAECCLREMDDFWAWVHGQIHEEES